ncbi:MAG: ATP-binding cassette domain-containing protein [Pseudomonadota bacterium]
MFEFRKISHTFGENSGALILEEISFEIREGECVGLTGPSGCGKSTLAQIGAGFVTPSSGEVLVDGRNLTSTPSRAVALIHQEADLFPWLKVEKQILFAMQKSDRSRAKELISLVKLSGAEKYYPNQLSGGMKKRLALARGLAINPKLLILDESFSSLDANLKYDLYRDLRLIWEKTKTTILLITHDSRDLQNLAHREVRLSAGKPTGIVEIVEMPAL